MSPWRFQRRNNVNDKQNVARSGVERDFNAKMEANTSLGIGENKRLYVYIYIYIEIEIERERDM